MILIGLTHTALTPVFATAFNPGAVWFAGAGIASVFLGLLNLAARHCTGRGVRSLTIAANVIGLLYGLGIVMVVPEPQAIAAIVILIALLIGSVAVRRPEGLR
jgi:hypothetical protein